MHWKRALGEERRCLIERGSNATVMAWWAEADMTAVVWRGEVARPEGESTARRRELHGTSGEEREFELRLVVEESIAIRSQGRDK